MTWRYKWLPYCCATVRSDFEWTRGKQSTEGAVVVSTTRGTQAMVGTSSAAIGSFPVLGLESWSRAER